MGTNLKKAERQTPSDAARAFADSPVALLPLPKYELRHSSGMHYGGETKYVTWTVDPKKYKSLELLHVTDVQFGHRECREDRVKEYLDWVLSRPNRFMLLGGDLVDAWALWSPGMPWDQCFGPDSQVFRLKELFAPARHRILGYVSGNHEQRAMRGFGDLGRLISYLLEIPYSQGQQFIDIKYGEHEPFKIALWHGRGSARTAGAKMQMIDRFMQTGDSQLYLVGHLHDAMVKYSWRVLRDPSSNKVYLQKIAGAMSSSFMAYFGTYAEVAGLSASDVMMARAVLEPDGGWELTLR